LALNANGDDARWTARSSRLKV